MGDLTCFFQITNLSPIIAFYHALVGAAAMLTCVATYMDHFPHIIDDPVRTFRRKTVRKCFQYFGEKLFENVFNTVAKNCSKWFLLE